MQHPLHAWLAEPEWRGKAGPALGRLREASHLPNLTMMGRDWPVPRHDPSLLASEHVVLMSRVFPPSRSQGHWKKRVLTRVYGCPINRQEL